MWERILVPLDGSNLAELALAYAEEISAAFNSEVVLLYVSEPKESQYRPMHQLYMDGVAKRVRERVKEHARVKAIALTGEPAEEIINYARRHKVGLIITASHGRSGVMSWATGGVANKVLQAARVPVLLIKVVKPPQRVAGKHLLNRILLPLDCSEAGEAALPYVQELRGRLESEVILFGVVAAGQHVRTVGGLDYIPYPEQDLKLVKAEVREYLDKVYHRVEGGKGTVRVELKVGGDVAGEIIRFAEETRASLIAISAHGRSGIGKWVFGSTASKILQTSKIPILLVRARKDKKEGSKRGRASNIL